MFREPIPSLAPGRRIRTILDSAISRTQDEYPDVYRVRIDYADDTGRRTFTDDQVIDLGLYWDTSEVRRKTVHHVAQQLEKIEREIRKWGATMPRGLLVVTPEEQREALKEFRRQRAELMQERAENVEPTDGDEAALD